MTVVVRDAESFLSALNEIAERKVNQALVAAHKEVVTFCFEAWATGKWTWSPMQPGDVWSGQSRASINVSIDHKDLTIAPENPGTWPVHPSPYPMPDVFEAAERMSGLGPYQTVYLTDAAPQAELAELHNSIANVAVTFTRSHYGKGFGPSVLVNDIPF